MSGFENRIATLLQDAVPEPGHDIDIATVERLGRRRRATAIAAPVVAAVVIALAVIAGVAFAGRSDKPVQPATPKTTSITESKVTLHYPSTWKRYVPAAGRRAPITADDPTRLLSTDAFRRVCSKPAGGGVAGVCTTTVPKLGDDGVYVGLNTFTPLSASSTNLTLTDSVAGLPAEVDEPIAVSSMCPAGTASSTVVTISVPGGPNTAKRYVGILGCVGKSAAAKRAFQHLLDTARYTP